MIYRFDQPTCPFCFSIINCSIHRNITDTNNLHIGQCQQCKLKHHVINTLSFINTCFGYHLQSISLQKDKWHYLKNLDYKTNVLQHSEGRVSSPKIYNLPASLIFTPSDFDHIDNILLLI